MLSRWVVFGVFLLRVAGGYNLRTAHTLPRPSTRKSYALPASKRFSCYSLKVNALFASSEAGSPETEGQASSKSISELLSELGLSFKLRAEENLKKAKESTTRTRKFFLGLVATMYYIMFLIYRSYRGFFVLLPAVFRRVYSRLEATVESDLSLEDGDKNATLMKASWKTKLTVSILSTVVTISYLIGGTIRIVGKFFRTIGTTSSVAESFGAAAKEACDHEDRIKRRMSLPNNNTEAREGTPPPKDGLSP